MQRMWCACIVVLAGLALAAMAGEQAETPKGLYTDEANGFSIALPEGWQTGPHPKTSGVIAFPPPQGKQGSGTVMVAVTWEDLARLIPLDKYIAASLKEVAAALPGYKVVEHAPFTINNWDALRLVASAEGKDAKVTWAHYCILKGRRAFVITCVCGTADFDRYKGSFDKVARSLRWIPEEEPGWYRNAEHSFAIRFPRGWDLSENPKYTAVITATSPLEAPDDPGRENVNVAVKDMGRSYPLDHVYSKALEDMKQSLTVEEIESSTVQIDGADARRLVYAATIRGHRLQNAVYLVVRGSKYYAITCTARPETFEKYRDVFAEIATSFKYQPPPEQPNAAGE